jgi:glycosyltransferase involved in cell wall biosynthesis
MRFWLVTVGEPIPIPGGRERLLRAGVLGGHLARAGHDVLWWTSTVDHFRKQFHPLSGAELIVEPRYRLRFLRGRLYRHNLSLARLRNHREIARDFRLSARSEPRPDLILCSLPTLELCREAVAYGTEHGVPVILDVRDPWPDVFYQVLPGPLRRLGPLVFAPFVREARAALREATGLLAVSQAYLDWGLRLAGRGAGPRDMVITHGYPTPPPVSEQDLSALRAELGVRPGMTVLWFVGSFAWHYDLGTVIDAARHLAGREDLLFVLTGGGDREAKWRARAAGLSNVRFTGWVDAAKIAALGRIASAGLVSYSPGAPMSLTNKLFEYMSTGLPLLLGLKGEAETIVRKWECGLVYRPGDAADLGRVVEALADDPGLRQRLSEGSVRAFQTAFAEEIIYPRFVHLLEREARAGT